MIGVPHVRLGLGLIGLVVWAYGVRVDDPRLRGIAIGFLAVAVLLRLAVPRRGRDTSTSHDDRPARD